MNKNIVFFILINLISLRSFSSDNNFSSCIEAASNVEQMEFCEETLMLKSSRIHSEITGYDLNFSDCTKDIATCAKNIETQIQEFDKILLEMSYAISSDYMAKKQQTQMSPSQINIAANLQNIPNREASVRQKISNETSSSIRLSLK